MEDGLYEELELVFDRIRQYEKRGEEVPIMELYFCYTVCLSPSSRGFH